MPMVSCAATARRSQRAGWVAALAAVATTALHGALAATPAAAGPAATDELPSSPADKRLQNAVVKVFSTVRYPDFYRPWSKQAPGEITGSGVVIEGNRILTNAHVVLYASQVQIQGDQAGDKIAAKVIAIAPDIDLAVLQLEDEAFFKDHAPLPRAKSLPPVKEAVLVYGYPTGGETMSITKGIVSRIEFAMYNNFVNGLRIQIDAAINPGNSGGPAVMGQQMIGIAFSRAGGDTQNIGYIIPNDEIELFLKDIADGHYDGKPALRDGWQNLENSALRSFLKLDKSVHGVIVSAPWPSEAASPLRKWDVVTQIGDTPIDDQGMVSPALAPDLHVRFQYLVQKLAQQGTVPLTVMRAGKLEHLKVPASADSRMLVPDIAGDYPPWFIYGPVVFSKATNQYMQGFYGISNVMVGLSVIGSRLVTERSKLVDDEHGELVVVSSPFFPDPLSRGYANHGASVVAAINGVRIRSLRHLVETLRDLKDDFVVIDFDQVGADALVFPRAEMAAATEHILADNGVRAQASDELLKVWNSVRN
jgi:S1-C subfamily serine protease